MMLEANNKFLLIKILESMLVSKSIRFPSNNNYFNRKLSSKNRLQKVVRQKYVKKIRACLELVRLGKN